MQPVNYNVRVFVDLAEIRTWSDETGIVIKVFDSYDGGGWTGYIVEFETRAGLDRFCNKFSPLGRPWGEDADGKHLPLS